MPTDFYSIYKPETEAEKQAIEQRREANALAWEGANKQAMQLYSSKEQLRQALDHGDFQQVGETLQRAGTCNWGEMLPGGKIEAFDGQNVKRFVAHLTLDHNGTTLELSERMPVGGLFAPDEYLPRLTVTGESCNDKRER